MGGALCVALGACGSSSQAPRELRDARAAYNRAEASRAQRYTPAQLHDAQVALKRAERAFQEDAEAPETRDIAYVAERKAQLAEIEAATAAVQQEAARNAEQSAREAHMAAQQAGATQEQLQQAQAELEREREMRKAAEQRAKDAFSRIGNVKEDARGTVITLPGSVLFASGESELRAAAESRLDAVADALQQADPKAFEVTVEGYTDSRGGEDLNMALSQKRADSVRNYLILQGLPREQIKAEGKGPANPVADNETPDGRAANRRVELVVNPVEAR